jgi:hypothetical protein
MVSHMSTPPPASPVPPNRNKLLLILGAIAVAAIIASYWFSRKNPAPISAVSTTAPRESPARMNRLSLPDWVPGCMSSEPEQFQTFPQGSGTHFEFYCYSHDRVAKVEDFYAKRFKAAGLRVTHGTPDGISLVILEGDDDQKKRSIQANIGINGQGLTQVFVGGMYVK